jgi:hypothetical protein
MIDTLPDDILHRQYLHIFGTPFHFKIDGFSRIIHVNKSHPVQDIPDRYKYGEESLSLHG